MRFITLFLFILSSSLRADVHPLLDHFHVCTVATYNHPHLEKLKTSCKKHKIELEVLGMHQPWYGNGTKFAYTLDYLNTLKDYEIVLFVDAFDTLIVADKAVILEKFLNSNSLFTMSVEKNCHPCEAYKGVFPPSPTPFRYLNTGSYIGYVGYLKRWLQDLSPIDLHLCDQGQTVAHYARDLKAKKFYTFDYFCDLFLPLLKVEENELSIDRKNKTLYCLTTNSSPSVIHANGGSFTLWNKIYERLIQE